MPHALGKGLTIFRQTAAYSVKWKAGKVVVKTRHVLGEEETFNAKRVVIALPLGVLQANTVKIDPMPQVLQNAVTRLQVGPIVKVLLRFRVPFWESSRAADFTFMHAVDQPVPVWWRVKPFDSTVLVGWAAGPNAAKLTGKPEEVILRAALASLEKAFHRGRLSADVDASKVIDWPQDPFARGGYMVVPVGQQQTQHALAQSVEQTLFFAGEHTNDAGHAGTVHGAIRTGVRAAQQVLRAAE